MKDGREVIVLSNHMVDIEVFVPEADTDIISERVHYPKLMELMEEYEEMNS